MTPFVRTNKKIGSRLYILTYVKRNTHTPFVGVFDEQAGQQRLGVGGERARELDVLHEDEFKQFLVVLVVERQSATHHLVRHHAQTPPVHRPAIVVVLEDLGRKKDTVPAF